MVHKNCSKNMICINQICGCGVNKTKKNIFKVKLFFMNKIIFFFQRPEHMMKTEKNVSIAKINSN